MPHLEFLADAIADLEAGGRLRRLRPVTARSGPEVEIDGRRAIDFASNDYLGLSAHPALRDASTAAIERWGTGAGASRLVSGDLAEHETLERELAAFHRSEAALLFNSGYHANLGVLSALAGPDDLIVSDALNHASIIDGCRLSRARVGVYRHADVEHADQLLAGPARRRFLVTESIFSMDGDRAPLVDLADAATARGAALVVDEAHAVGWLGPDGRGLAAELGVVVDVLVGTLGKAFGSFGGYAAGSDLLRRWLLGSARTFVFTTGLPAAVVAASRAGLDLVGSAEGAARSARLLENCLHARSSLSVAGDPSPIVPLVVGDDHRVMELSETLLESGIFIQGIRPPTVPRGTARLRLTLSSEHTPANLARALDLLRPHFA